MNLQNLKNFKTNKQTTLSLLVLCFILLLWFLKIPLLESISLKLNDHNYFLKQNHPHKDIVFLAVDEKSVNKYGRWPWDREILAQGLDKLHYAKAVVLDMVFSEKTNEQSDEILSNSLENLDNSICGFFLRNDASETISEEQQEILSESSLERIFINKNIFVETTYAEINIQNILETCVFNATFSTLPDKDGLYRRYPIGVVFNSHVYPSLGIQTLRYIYNKDIEMYDENDEYYINFDDKKIAIDSEGFLLLNYYPLNSYNLISFSDLTSGKFKPDYFKDKIVLVGITEAGVSDIRATPLGQIPGPLLHYTFLSNYLQDIIIKKDFRIDFVLLIIIGFLMILISHKVVKITNRAIFYILLLLIYFIVIKYLYIYHHLWLDIFYILLMFFAITSVNELLLFQNKENENRYIKGAFRNYVSDKLVDEIIKNPKALKLGGQKKEISVMFVDLRNFTNLSEKISPEELIEVLNIYFSPMTKIVLDNNGTLDKYIGDAIMAFFNAPIDIKKHEYFAVKCAIEMRDELKNVNKILDKKGLPTLDLGIGINTAQMVVGNIGSHNRFDYSVVGDGVNVASRLESLNKLYNTKIIISEFTYEKVKQYFITKRIDKVKLKGKDEKINVYEVIDFKN